MSISRPRRIKPKGKVRLKYFPLKRETPSQEDIITVDLGESSLTSN